MEIKTVEQKAFFFPLENEDTKLKEEIKTRSHTKNLKGVKAKELP